MVNRDGRRRTDELPQLEERNTLRRGTSWFTPKEDSSATALYSLKDFELSVTRKNTGSIDNAYRNGKLGALPMLKDYDVSHSE